jgi:ribonuclease P protein component
VVFFSFFNYKNIRGIGCVQRKLRLRNRNDFSRVYRGGKSFANGQFVVYWSRQLLAEPFRMGVSVSKKLGNAVVRNRLRRVVKEIVRANEEQIKDHLDFILIVRKPAVDMKTKDLEKSMLHVLRKAGLLKMRTEPKN